MLHWRCKETFSPLMAVIFYIICWRRLIPPPFPPENQVILLQNPPFKKRLRGDIFVKWVTALSFSLTTLNAAVSIYDSGKKCQKYSSVLFFTPPPPPLPSWRVILLALVIARLNTTRYDDWRLFCLLRYFKCCRKKMCGRKLNIQWILLNNPRDEVEGVIQQYSLSLR